MQKPILQLDNMIRLDKIYSQIMSIASGSIVTLPMVILVSKSDFNKTGMKDWDNKLMIKFCNQILQGVSHAYVTNNINERLLFRTWTYFNSKKRPRIPESNKSLIKLTALSS